LAEGYADGVIDEFYEHLLQFPDARDYFVDPAILQRVKRLQMRYFLQLTRGEYDLHYGQDRLRIGDRCC
jgi:rsbT co-antagonist protein RsbR